MNRTVKVVLGVVVALVLAGGSFYGGLLYGQQTAEADLLQMAPGDWPAVGEGPTEEGWPAGGERPAAGERPEGAGTGAPGGLTGRGAQGGGVTGQIESIDGDTLLVGGAGGEQIHVLVTETTLIEKYASVTVEELTVGEQVVVSGTENDDGSYTARSVQVAPQGRFAPGAAGGSNAP